jgi:hypothetical protein
MKRLTRKWPRLFTCPTDALGIAKDDLGETVFNPIFSNRAKMIRDCEACDGCDMGDAGECSGPVEYRPLKRRI